MILGYQPLSFNVSYIELTLDMTRIGQLNYQDHGWREEISPERASAAKGEGDIQRIIDCMDRRIKECLEK